MAEFKAQFGLGWKVGTCDVCSRVEEDEAKRTEQKRVQWCGKCQSWICEGCSFKGWSWESVKVLKRRGKAAAMRFLGMAA